MFQLYESAIFMRKTLVETYMSVHYFLCGSVPKWWFRLIGARFHFYVAVTTILDNNQSSSMALKFHMPTQQNILVWLLMPSCSGKSMLRTKRDKLNIKFRKMYRLLGCNSELSVHNKIILYRQVIRPIWSHGTQLWGCASDSNIEQIQWYQNKVLKAIVNTPWYFQNSDHHDLRIKTITDIIAKFTNSHGKRLQASRLLNVNNITRSLKQNKPFELVTH
jgi:hypothetical protein